MILERKLPRSHYFKYQLKFTFLATLSLQGRGGDTWYTWGDGGRNGESTPTFSFTLLSDVHGTQKSPIFMALCPLGSLFFSPE